jgi:hypothetical protein
MADPPAIPQIRRRRRHTDETGESGWYTIAVAARDKIEDTPHGERNARLAAVAAQLGRRPDTIRRFIAAASFVDRLEEKDLSTVLVRLPVAGVELISRWWAYDSKEARKAANDLATGSFNVQALKAAEKQAREASTAVRWGRAGHYSLRNRLHSQIKQMVQIEGEPAFVLDEPKRFDPRKLDFLFRSDGDENYRISVLLFGPFQDEELYRTRQDDFLLSILGLSRAYTKVIGIIPTGLDRLMYEFEAWLDHVGDPNITFHYVDQNSAEVFSPRPIHGRLVKIDIDE